MKKLYEPHTDTIKKISEDITKTMMLTSKKNNLALETLNNKLTEIMNDRGIVASYLTSPLSKISNPENTIQFKLVKDSNSNRFNDLIKNKTIPVTLYNTLLIFLYTDKNFELNEDLLKMITKNIFIADFANLKDKKLKYDFAKEMYFDVKAPDNKPSRDQTLIKLLKSHSTVAFASDISKTRFLTSDPNELCDRLK